MCAFEFVSVEEVTCINNLPYFMYMDFFFFFFLL